MSEKPVLVTGATGNVGRHVVTGLLDKGVKVRALTRNPSAATLAPEVAVFKGDFSTPDTLDAALDGVETVFFVWRSFGADVGSVLEKIRKHARRIVFLSSSAVRDDIAQQDNPIGQIHADIEQLIGKSGLAWTFLRPGGFASNGISWWGPQIRVGDVVRWPYAASAQAPIDERDIAAVAIRALTDASHDGAKYRLTGPHVLTQADQVKTIGEAIGRPLRFEEVSAEAARKQMLTMMPAAIVDMLLGTLARLVSEPFPATATVQQVTGAPAHSFREWAKLHANDFRLSAETSPVPAMASRESTAN